MPSPSRSPRPLSGRRLVSFLYRLPALCRAIAGTPGGTTVRRLSVFRTLGAINWRVFSVFSGSGRVLPAEDAAGQRREPWSGSSGELRNLEGDRAEDGTFSVLASDLWSPACARGAYPRRMSLLHRFSKCFPLRVSPLRIMMLPTPCTPEARRLHPMEAPENLGSSLAPLWRGRCIHGSYSPLVGRPGFRFAGSYLKTRKKAHLCLWQS